MRFKGYRLILPEGIGQGIALIAGILLAGALCALYLQYFRDVAWLMPLQENTCESEEFCRMSFPGDSLNQIMQFSEREDLDPWSCIAVLMLKNGFVLNESSASSIQKAQAEEMIAQAKNWKPEEFFQLREAYRRVLEGLEYFPVARSASQEVKWVTFENSWGDGRSFGGERKHEGCDIMGMEYPRGFYPVVASAGGTVEQIGWLPQGGWRIGIRRPGGGYDYYAHLYGYRDGIEAGTEVAAGELLGYMGDSGYSEIPGTVGNFPVHLHFGIYIQTPHLEERSVNSYDILRYLERRQMTADYKENMK
ncbi:M23 family metallopeptidase [Cuneatibacter caecimuris]|uniref:Murein DD-endopeptidase MepM/ murein hydrolase activator NlpD n=1 Tax=Cuneatibacter caecimuris TaxID=1796618 RepID=A0A4Q7P0S9_9FIRM|nr:M23 family metallopeptidase [Cuneatibacter caecimuris]RZS92898.1 murein DD-endopeptidase MepM/ murein hydrolase activator NlpD [Cuneatibacter caecimuris]